MERVVTAANMNMAYKHVVSTKGSAGVDRMTVDGLKGWIYEHKDTLLQGLLDVTYRPYDVLGGEIAKPGGGTRQLGIPTVIDRMVQQACDKGWMNTSQTALL